MPDAIGHKAVLARLYQRWHETRGGSVDEIMAICDDEIAFGSLAQGAMPLAFTAKAAGKAQLAGYFEGLTGGWNMNHYTIHHTIAEGDCVVAVGSTSWTNKATGKSVETPKVDVWRFKDGKAVEFYEYYDTAKVIEAAIP